jgi:predicted RNA-binding protein YlxR (DUF448 family)
MAAETLTDREMPAQGRVRRCIVTHEALPEAGLIRFVRDPQGVMVPDLAAKLPGRGVWVSARREVLERALAKGHFSRAAHAPVSVPDDICRRIEALFVARMAGDLGLARRSGQIALGFDNVARALAGAWRAGIVLVEASDGAADGRRKLLALARPQRPVVIDVLTAAEMSLALGRENVVHAALKSGRLSERLTADAGRLRGFRPASPGIEARMTAEAGTACAGNQGRE